MTTPFGKTSLNVRLFGRFLLRLKKHAERRKSVRILGVTSQHGRHVPDWPPIALDIHVRASQKSLMVAQYPTNLEI
jgi:hypothetical protein